MRHILDLQRYPIDHLETPEARAHAQRLQREEYLHRVRPLSGNKDRIIAILSYYERPGVVFSAEERLGFYGRAD